MKTLEFLLLLLFVAIQSVTGDTWELPTTEMFYSADSSYAVKVIPTFWPEKYEQWLAANPKKKNKFSPEDTTIIHCHAILYKRHGNDSTVIWERKLINKVRPISILVSNDGKFVVTFDNWYSAGYGVDVMVVYNKKGDFVKRFNLEDISPFPLNDYQFSISSIWWCCGKKFIDDHRIEICFSTQKGRKIIRVFDLMNLKFKE